MITVVFFALVFYFIFVLSCGEDLFDFSYSLCITSVFIGIILTLILSCVLFGLGVGHYVIVESDYYESLTFTNDDCDVIIYNYDDSLIYSVDNVSVALHRCFFIDDGTHVIELQRWHYFNGYDWLLLLPIFESYIIHK